MAFFRNLLSLQGFPSEPLFGPRPPAATRPHAGSPAGDGDGAAPTRGQAPEKPEPQPSRPARRAA